MDYSAEVEFKRDKILCEDHEYLLSFDRVDSLHHVHVMLSYVGNIWSA